MSGVLSRWEARAMRRARIALSRVTGAYEVRVDGELIGRASSIAAGADFAREYLRGDR